VSARGGDFQRAFDMLLAFDIVEIGWIARVLIEDFFQIDRAARKSAASTQLATLRGPSAMRLRAANSPIVSRVAAAPGVARGHVPREPPR